MKRKIFNFSYILFTILYLEIMFKLLIFKEIRVSELLYTLIFTVPIALTINLIINLFKEKISKILLITFISIIVIYFLIQLIFYTLFSVPFSFSTIGLAGNALDFTNIIFETIKKNMLSIICYILPIALFIILNKDIKFEGYKLQWKIVNSLLIILTIIISNVAVKLDKNGLYSAYNLYYKINAQEKNIKKFGVLEATRNRYKKNYNKF